METYITQSGLSRLQDIDREIHRLRWERLRLVHPLRQLFWECTLRCNMSCLHCGTDCKKEEQRPDMPLEDFLAVLDDLRTHLDPRRVLVNTVGGEPLARTDLARCGAEITRRGFQWGMVTNGYLLTSKKLAELQEAGLRTIAVSLDGLEEEHNWLRGHPLAFSHAVTAIRALAASSNLMWDVITCVNRRNIGQLPALKDFLTGLGVKRWRCCTIFPSGRAAHNPELQLTSAEFRQLMDFIVAVRAEGVIRLNYGCEGYLGEYEGRVRDYLYACQAGQSVASVLSDGSISGCLSIRSNYHQGNIYKDNFWEVWNRRFQVYRDAEWKRTGICRDCSLFADCQGNGMHLRSDDGSLALCHYRKLHGEE